MISLISVAVGLLFGSVGWFWVLAIAYAYFYAADAWAGQGRSDGFSTIHGLQLGFLVVSLVGLVGLADVVVRTWRPIPLWFVFGIGTGSVGITGLFMEYIVRTSERGIGRAGATGMATAVGIVATTGMVVAVICSYWFRFWR